MYNKQNLQEGDVKVSKFSEVILSQHSDVCL